MNEFLNFFLDEAVDILVEWEKVSLRLEKDSSVETKDELYRAAHNLKSGSGAVGLDAFHHLVHAVEDLISSVMTNADALPPAAIRIFLETHSCLSAWVDRLRNGDETIPQDEIDGINASLEPFFPEKASKDLGSESVLKESEDAVPVAPVIESPPPETHTPNSVAPPPSPERQAPILKGSEGNEDLRKATAPSSAPAAKPQETIRVAANKLDNLIELVGELATQQAIVWHGRQLGQLESESCDNAIHLIQKIAKDLQGLSLSLRLQPLQSLFQRLERTIRDLARTQGKKIDVVLVGEDVELDKSVAERIADALTHVVRNAIDHGVEMSADREAQGKRPAATIILEATPAANGVLIKISDDGRGLNTDRIRNKAIERGLITPSNQLSENDIHRLIFHAGLSTAEKVTDVSGRGVGMDVVKTSVENIGGSIHLSSSFGRGTTFSISLPATLSIVDALLVRAGQSLFAIPLQDVAEIIDLNEIDVQMMPGGNRLLNLRSSVIPLENLAKHLPMERNKRNADKSIPLDDRSAMRPAIIVRSGDSLLAFEVNLIVGQQLVTVRGLPTAIATIPGYIGGTILGDGSPCVVLNLISLASRHFEDIHRGVGSSQTNDIFTASYEDEDERFLIMRQGSYVFASSLMSVREILQNIPCENLLGHETHKRYIAVRGELIPVYELSGYAEQSESSENFVVTADGNRAFAVSQILAVANLERVDSHEDFGSQDNTISGVMGFRRYHDKYIPLIDLSLALHLQSKRDAQSFEGRTAS